MGAILHWTNPKDCDDSTCFFSVDVGNPEVTQLLKAAHSDLLSKWSAPAGRFSRPGLSIVPGASELDQDREKSAKGPVSRILSCAVIPLDAASPRTFISDLPGGFGDCIDQPERAPRYARSSLTAPGRHRAAALLLAATSLPIWSCSVWGLPCPRHYCRSGALLPHLFTLTPALEIPQRRLYPASRGNTGIAVPGWPSCRIRRNGEG